ncbi:MAG: bacteriohemerythrin [Magnetococcus sp. WYHC-3]
MDTTWVQVADVGVEVFNNDHQRLLFYVVEFNRLVARFQQRAPQEDEWDAIDGIFPRLEKYTQHHFRAEEALMRAHHYPRLAEHVGFHGHLLARIAQLRAAIAARQAEAITDLQSFLLDWLRTHINREDVQYRGYFQLEETREVLDRAVFNEMISADQLRMIVDAARPDTVIVDLRTATEQAEGIIPCSVLFPCDHNLDNRADTGPFTRSFTRRFDATLLDADKRYVLVCRSGPRAEIALEAFLEQGLKACELIGGMVEWQHQNHPVVAVDGQTLHLPHGED